MMYNEKMLESFSKEYAERCQVTDKITAELFDANGVLRGLRDKNGNGVVAGLTNISKIEAFRMENGEKIPCDGNLWYRGYNVIDLVKGFEGKLHGADFRITDVEKAYILPAKLLALTVYRLLGNGGRAAEKICSEYTPVFDRESYTRYVRQQINKK